MNFMTFLSVLVVGWLRRLQRLVVEMMWKVTINVNKSMFIRGTDGKEIIDIVKTFKNKKSTDWNGIDMSIVKNIIECVVCF